MEYDIQTPQGNLKHFPEENLVRVYNDDGELIKEIPVDPNFGQATTQIDYSAVIQGLQTALDYINDYIAGTTELTKLQILFFNEQAYENYKASGVRLQECEELLTRISLATNKLTQLESLGLL